jgi:predicted RNA-binding protein
VDYWLDLFTGRTWKEFRDSGANVSGFRERRRNTVKSIKPGDILLCYLTGVMRWIGALEVVGQSNDAKKIWSLDDFPERLAVRPIVMLDPEYGIPMDTLKGKVEFFKDDSDQQYFKGFLRGSPNKFQKKEDGELIITLLKEVERNPVSRPFDSKLFDRIPLYKVSQKGKGSAKPKVVSVPDEEEHSLPEVAPKTETETQYTTDHVMIQYRLLRLGAEMGLDVWVARNDRSKVYSGKTLGSLPRMVQELPAQFNDATQRTIELIDILWLKGNSIIAAFEVESTTSIYSGLLRMSDLLALQPNLNIKLYLVASDERHNKVKQEILRPTFELSAKPLSKVCGFISISNLNQKIDGIQKLGLASALNPEFLDKVAEYFEADEN